MAKLPATFASPADIEMSFRAAGASADEAKGIAAAALPGVSIVSTPFDEYDDAKDVHLGGTRIGGVPDIPALFDWPWRPAYTDAEARIAESRAAFEALEPADLEAMQTVMLEEAKKHLSPEQVAVLTAEAARVDFNEVEFSDLGDDVLRCSDSAPLSFIAQIDLAEMWRAGPLDPDMPREGRLLLFYDADQMPTGCRPSDTIGARLIYETSPVDALEPRLPPEELEDIGPVGLFPVHLCAFSASWYPPYPGSSPLDATPLSQTTERALPRWWSEISEEDNDSRLGGHPTQMQGDMAIECALAAAGHDVAGATPAEPAAIAGAKLAAAEWVLLMQVASIDTADMMWGDMGKLYVWISRASLRARRFDEARVILQSV